MWSVQGRPTGSTVLCSESYFPIIIRNRVTQAWGQWCRKLKWCQAGLDEWSVQPNTWSALSARRGGKACCPTRLQPQMVRHKSQTSQISLIITVILPPPILSKLSLNLFSFASLPSPGWINSRCFSFLGTVLLPISSLIASFSFSYSCFHHLEVLNLLHILPDISLWPLSSYLLRMNKTNINIYFQGQPLHALRGFKYSFLNLALGTNAFMAGEWEL